MVSARFGKVRRAVKRWSGFADPENRGPGPRQFHLVEDGRCSFKSPRAYGEPTLFGVLAQNALLPHLRSFLKSQQDKAKANQHHI